MPFAEAHAEILASTDANPPPILVHLAEPGIELTVRIEIDASAARGFTETQVRTVAENAATLRFEQSGFEEE